MVGYTDSWKVNVHSYVLINFSIYTGVAVMVVVVVCNLTSFCDYKGLQTPTNAQNPSYTIYFHYSTVTTNIIETFTIFHLTHTSNLTLRPPHTPVASYLYSSKTRRVVIYCKGSPWQPPLYWQIVSIVCWGQTQPCLGNCGLQLVMCI